MTSDALKGIERIISLHKDAALVKAAVNGDEKSFEKLIASNKKRIKAVGASFFTNQDDIEDFVQEVFVKAYVNLSNFRYEASFATWITRIAYNIAISSKKRAKEFMPLVNDEIIQDKKCTPEEEQIRNITIEAVREALTGLPEKYAICLELYFFHDRSYNEIELICNIPVNTIKSHIFRAKKILREKLRGFYEN